MIKGISALEIFSKDILEREAAIKAHTPKGGVISPTERLTAFRTPKCTGSTPIFKIMGRSIGRVRITAARVSIKVHF